MHNIFKLTVASESLKTTIETFILSYDLYKTNTVVLLMYLRHIKHYD